MNFLVICMGWDPPSPSLRRDRLYTTYGTYRIVRNNAYRTHESCPIVRRLTSGSAASQVLRPKPQQAPIPVAIYSWWQREPRPTKYAGSILLAPRFSLLAPLQEFHGGVDAAFFEGDTEKGQTYLDAAQGAAQHQIVEIAKVTDSECSAFKFSKAGTQR